ncbi:MAG: response regulator [Oceanococcus sp.]
MANILVIDDEPVHLKLVAMFLEDTPHKLQCFESPVTAWETLLAHSETIDLILIDRLMPILDGMSFVRKAKANESTSAIPIIMQTVAASAVQVAEGIDAGVHYYLTKPYDQQVLRAIINAAVDDFAAAKALRTDIDQYSYLSHCLQQGTFLFRTIDEAMQLARGLSNLYPDPKRVVTGLSELMINAVEHGNLGISYAEKSRLIEQERWKEEINRRLALKEYSHRQARVEIEVTQGHIEARICDEGEGFDWAKYIEPDPERMMDAHGRGILIAKGMSFDNLEYSATGTCVTTRCHR